MEINACLQIEDDKNEAEILLCLEEAEIRCLIRNLKRVKYNFKLQQC